MSLSGCARDIAMGVTSSIGGWIVAREPSGHLINFHWLGWIAVGAAMLSLWLGSKVIVNEAEAPRATPAALSIGSSLNPELMTQNEGT